MLLAILLSLARCTPEKGDTIILVGEEAAFKTPRQLMDKLTNAQQGSFFASLPGRVDTTGLFPPDVMGEYKISPKQFVKSNIGFDFFDDDNDVLLRVFEQQNRMAKVDFFEGGHSRVDDAYVIGEGNRFTIYFTEEREVEFMGVAYRYDRLIMVNGVKTDQGLSNLYFGNVILGVENGIDPLVGDFEPGWYFIYKDADGLAELGHWFKE